MITDKMRVELALPPRMLFTLACTKAFVCYDDKGEVQDASGHETVQKVQKLLLAACLEPLEGLPRERGAKLARRIERVHEEVTKRFEERSAVGAGLTIVYWFQDLLEREVLVLHEGSAVAMAADILIPMLEHGTAIEALDKSARKQARQLLRDLQARGFYLDREAA